MKPVEIVQMRIDRWLWAARFYKTRQLAAFAVNGGKVHLNGQRCKAGKKIKIGSLLDITKNGLVWHIQVEVIPKQRRPASEAIHFYSESAESKAERKVQSSLMRAQNKARPQTEHRPNKKERRHIHRFKNNL